MQPTANLITDEIIEQYDLSDRDTGLYRRALELIAFLNANPDTITRLSPATREVTEFKKRGKGKLPRSKKGGKAPLEFTAVDTKVDLEAALRDYNTRAVRVNYHRLAKMVGW